MNILGIDGYFLGSISLGLTIYFYEAMGDRLDVVATTIDVLVVNVTIVYAMVVGAKVVGAMVVGAVVVGVMVATAMVAATTMNATRGVERGGLVWVKWVK
jgi:hypothetical protein